MEGANATAAQDTLEKTSAQIQEVICRGPAPVDPGNSKGGWRWRGKTCLLIDKRLDYSVVGRLSGGRGLNSLVYAEDQ